MEAVAKRSCSAGAQGLHSNLGLGGQVPSIAQDKEV